MRTREEINTLWEELESQAWEMTMIVIRAFCKRNRCECITNGPFGTMVTKYSKQPRSGYVWDGKRYAKEIEAPEIEELTQWYEEKFGPCPQEIVP